MQVGKNKKTESTGRLEVLGLLSKELKGRTEDAERN